MRLCRSPHRAALRLAGLLLIAVACTAEKPERLAAPAERHATVEELRGDVKVKRREREEWVPATVGMELTRDDKLRTLGGASAALRFDEGSLVAMDEDSLLVVGELAGESARRAGVTLLRGRLDAEVDRNHSSDFTVRTPAATARAGRKVVFQ